MDTPELLESTQVEASPRIRLWPVGVILALAAGALLTIWQFLDLHRQGLYIKSAEVFLATIGALLVWVLFASRLRWKNRLLACGGVLGLVGLLAATLEIRGVTGDLLLVLEWRWTKTSSEQLTIEAAEVEPGSIPLPVESAHDFPQFSGPDRNGKLAGPRLAKDWDAQPPELLWRQPIGTAWSGFAIVGQYAVTMEQRGDSELVTCYHLTTGELIWTHADKTYFESIIAGSGPRTVPTIVDGRVFTLGSTGQMNCLDLLDGKVIWAKNVAEENIAPSEDGTILPDWGISCSPLVAEGKVLVTVGAEEGRSLIAYDVLTGDEVWSAGDDNASYSSPLLASIDGRPQVLIFNDPGVKSHALDSGEVLWGYDWRGGHPHIALPVVLPDGRVLISSGYGTGSELLQVGQEDSEGWSAEPIWESKKLKSKFANLIVRDGSIYGLDDGILACLDLETGKRQWKKGRYGHGQMILVGDLLLVMAESGEAVLLEPTPKKHRELTRFAVLDSKTWNPPALAGEYLLVRNDKEVACYRLALE